MKARIISGFCYALVLVAFFLLKWFLNDYWFDVLIWLFCLIGSFEMTRACGLPKPQKGIAIVFGLTCIPVFVAGELAWGLGAVLFGCFFALACVAMLSTLVGSYEQVTLESTAKGVLSLVYPSLLLGVMAYVNHMEDSMAALLLIFVSSPLADVFAHAFGTALHDKFPKKMAPAISPNKTVIGGIGGLIGGIVGGLLVFLLLYLTERTAFGVWQGLLFFGILGLFCALLTEFGDLVESAIKRKVDIKDMGNLMPGHGGILDRIDGTMYVTLLVCVVFVLVSFL